MIPALTLTYRVEFGASVGWTLAGALIGVGCLIALHAYLRRPPIVEAAPLRPFPRDAA